MQSKFVSLEDPIVIQNGIPEDGQEGWNMWELLNTFDTWMCTSLDVSVDKLAKICRFNHFINPIITTKKWPSSFQQSHCHYNQLPGSRNQSSSLLIPRFVSAHHRETVHHHHNFSPSCQSSYFIISPSWTPKWMFSGQFPHENSICIGHIAQHNQHITTLRMLLQYGY